LKQAQGFVPITLSVDLKNLLEGGDALDLFLPNLSPLA